METENAPTTASNKIEQIWTSASNKIATATVTGSSESTFLDSKTRGIIKFIPLDSNSSIQPVEILAEDVKIEKQVAINSQTTLGQKQTSVSSEDGTETTTEETSQLTIQFNTTFTPSGYAKRSEFIEARANFLFNYEDNVFLAISDLFRKATPMQVRNVQYSIPSGEDNAYYTIQIIQVEEALDDRTAQSSQPEDERSSQTGESYLPNVKSSNYGTNSTST
jgi:hypothetical protein